MKEIKESRSDTDLRYGLPLPDSVWRGKWLRMETEEGRAKEPAGIWRVTARRLKSD
jgi:hypothetical protein